MIDFHCHLDLYPAPYEVVEEVQRRGIGVLSVTTTPSAWIGTSRLADGRSMVRTAIGLHPQIAKERRQELRIFDRYVADTRFVGEVGLDGSPELRGSWADQTVVFDHILSTCAEAGNKILSIHSRRAATPVLDALEKHAGSYTPILHWFSGTQSELKRAVALGCWFSVGPAMLAGKKGRSLLSSIPRDRVLLETDGPFIRFRGSLIRPWNVADGCHLLAEVWAEGFDFTEGQIRRNEEALMRVSL